MVKVATALGLVAGTASWAAAVGEDAQELLAAVAEAGWTFKDFTLGGAVAIVGICAVAMAPRIIRTIGDTRNGRRKNGESDVERRDGAIAIHDLETGQRNLKDTMETGFTQMREELKEMREDIRLAMDIAAKR